jgi:tetratricopeptide (TPR) repeat protein
MFNLGRLAGARGDRRRQEELWRRAIAVRPDFVRGHYLLAKLLMDSGGDLDEAETLVRQGLARDRDHASGPLGYLVLADILNRLDRGVEAREALGRAREIQSGASNGATATRG